MVKRQYYPRWIHWSIVYSVPLPYLSPLSLRRHFAFQQWHNELAFTFALIVVKKNLEGLWVFSSSVWMSVSIDSWILRYISCLCCTLVLLTPLWNLLFLLSSFSEPWWVAYECKVLRWLLWINSIHNKLFYIIMFRQCFTLFFFFLCYDEKETPILRYINLYKPVTFIVI